jgi:hypothetical protein
MLRKLRVSKRIPSQLKNKAFREGQRDGKKTIKILERREIPKEEWPEKVLDHAPGIPEWIEDFDEGEFEERSGELEHDYLEGFTETSSWFGDLDKIIEERENR